MDLLFGSIIDKMSLVISYWAYLISKVYKTRKIDTWLSYADLHSQHQNHSDQRRGKDIAEEKFEWHYKEVVHLAINEMKTLTKA